MKKKILAGLAAALFAFGFAGIASADLTDGLMAYYPFYGNANDESVNNNNGTVIGATLVEDRFGNINNAYNFNGVSDYIVVSSSDNLTIQNEITISAWFKATNIQQGYAWQTIISKGATYGQLWADYNLTIENTNDMHWESSDNSNTSYYVNADYEFQNERWYHALATYNNSAVKMYIDGTLVIEGTVNNNTLRVSTQPLYIGTRYPPYHSQQEASFYGAIDDVRIYNRTLSESEIQQLSVVPEPISSTLFLIGGAALGFRRFRRSV